MLQRAGSLNSRPAPAGGDVQFAIGGDDDDDEDDTRGLTRPAANVLKRHI